MPERELIEHLCGRLVGSEPPWLEIGVGDDSAQISAGPDCHIVLTTDAVEEDVHFLPGTAPNLIGRKAIARALSDLAAMASRPLCTLATAKFPAGAEDDFCQGIVDALIDSARQFGAPLVGGDVRSSAGGTAITVTALGLPGPGGSVRRGGGRPGDAICVTGSLGGSLRGRHLTFEPRIREALALVERAPVRAMIDISDGLSTDALHLAEAGGVGVRLYEDAIPVSDAAAEMAAEDGKAALWHALHDGEDYELLFCTGADPAEALAEDGILGVDVRVIGEVVEGGSCLVRGDGSEEELRPGGWEHLTSD